MKSILILVGGAAASVLLMLRVGHRNNSMLLLALFVIWVSSPFAALAVASVKRLNAPLTITSVVIYGYAAFGPPLAKPAAPFLMVPLASWLAIGIAWLAGRRRRSARS